MTTEQELFAATAKIDLAQAVKHIRDWRCHIDDHHRQKYADLLEAQAKLIAHLLQSRTDKLDVLRGQINAIGGYAGEYDDYGKGINYAVEQALYKIEDAGGRDPNHNGPKTDS